MIDISEIKIRKTIYSILVLILSVLMTSCYSYRIFPKEYRKMKSIEVNNQKAYVINRDLKKEYKILEKSKLFQIVEDSLNPLKIKLYPLEQVAKVDGQPIVLSMLTLGQVPVIFPDKYQFKFEEIENNQSKIKSFEIILAQRVWFWDMLSFKKDFEGKFGKALYGAFKDQKN